MILHDFFSAVSSFDETRLTELVHPDVRISEMPNAMNRGGTERDLEAALVAFRRGRGMLAEQSYEVHDVLRDGDAVAARVTWRGRLATGTELTAHVATFTRLRDGRIWRHSTYDCYEPPGGGSQSQAIETVP